MYCVCAVLPTAYQKHPIGLIWSMTKALTPFAYTLSNLENARDVSAYSEGRRLSSRAQLVCFLTRSKRNTEIDA